MNTTIMSHNKQHQADSQQPTDYLALVDSALAEDIGPGDVTTTSIVDKDRRSQATIRQKAAGVIFGLVVAGLVFHRLDPELDFRPLIKEGNWNSSGCEILHLEGSTAALLTGERTALNFLAHLSGIATKTAQLVKQVHKINPTITILDTRKTTPGLRTLEKAAVAAGGGANHRVGLFDAILIKENHIAAAGSIHEAVTRARSAHPELPLEVEVQNPNEIDQALSAHATRLLLDNLTPEEVRAAVAQVDGRAELEVSGGISSQTIGDYAAIKGVDYISVGALTHSAPALDLSMIVE